MKRFRAALLLALPALLGASSAVGYPLDGYESTGIRRLLGLSLAQQGLVRDSRLPPGALLDLADVDLRLLGRRDFDVPAPDAELTRQLVDMLGGEAESYGLAVLDLTDPAGHPLRRAPR